MRKAAEAVVELATAEYGRDERFWAILRNHALSIAPLAPSPPATVTPLSDEAARKFGRRTLGFGIHRDKRYDEVPLDYLEWLADQHTDLVRYIRSQRVQREHATE
jgi:hypothetical protein